MVKVSHQVKYGWNLISHNLRSSWDIEAGLSFICWQVIDEPLIFSSQVIPSKGRLDLHRDEESFRSIQHGLSLGKITWSCQKRNSKIQAYFWKLRMSSLLIVYSVFSETCNWLWHPKKIGCGRKNVSWHSFATNWPSQLLLADFYLDN